MRDAKTGPIPSSASNSFADARFTNTTPELFGFTFTVDFVGAFEPEEELLA